MAGAANRQRAAGRTARSLAPRTQGPTERRGRTVLRALAWVLLSLPSPVRLGVAQSDSATLHATLREWSDEMWLRLLDRSAALDGGRLNPRGTLQRFHADIDAEYDLDVVSAGFGLAESYTWHRRETGARYWTGSINHERLISGGTIKAAVPLGRRWSVAVRYDHHDIPALRRNLIRARFTKQWNGPFAYVEGSLLAYKPENDLSFGVGWRGRAGEATVAFTLLDAFSDIVYQVLEVYPGFADTALDYERQPLALRATVERSLGPRLRVEADAGVMFPSRVRAYRQLAPDQGARLEERFALAGALIEWAVSPRLRAGGFAQYVRAVTDRTPLLPGPLDQDYRLVERTSSAGVFLLAQPAPRWRVEAWTARTLRPEKRDHRAPVVEDVDYEDHTWVGQALLGYRARGGFKLNATLEWDLRDVMRGEGDVPALESLGWRNTRVKLDFGWQVRGRFDVVLGYRTDLDGDTYTDHGRFDGAHGRFVMYW